MRRPRIGASLSEKHPSVAALWDVERNTLTPGEIAPGSRLSVWWKCPRGHSWENEVLSQSGRRRGCQFCSNHAVWQGFNDFATYHPDLLHEWDYDKNGDRMPTDFVYGSATVCHWVCTEGHRFEARVVHRHLGLMCPICSGKRVLTGYNDLATTHPEIVKSWDFEANTMPPENFTFGSVHKAHWICSTRGHHWRAAIYSRAAGIGCPVCTNKAVLVGYNDLVTVRPEIAVQWHPTLNGAKKPDQVTEHSDVRVWWLCGTGHQWEARVKKRTRTDAPGGCPFCANKSILRGFNDLETTHPELAAEWDSEAGQKHSPNTVSPGSNYRASWICDKGHRWQAQVAKRSGFGSSVGGTGCPTCANRIVVEGFNDLASQRPDLMSEWDYDVNYPLDPAALPVEYPKPVAWIDRHRHKWLASPYSRAALNTGCPVCVNQVILPGFNDLATTHPEVSAQWDRDANAPFLPTQVSAGNNKRVGWLCEEGHHWSTTTASRTRSSPSGCPVCVKWATSMSEQALRDAVIQSSILAGVESHTHVRLPVAYVSTSGPRPRRSSSWVDIYGTHRVTKRSVVIEYDGEYYHKGARKTAVDVSKTMALLSAGHIVIRIRENALAHLEVRHENLMQISHPYSRDSKMFVSIVEEIDGFILERSGNSSFRA